MQKHTFLKGKIYLFSTSQIERILMLFILIGVFQFRAFTQNSQPDTLGDFELVKCTVNERNLRNQNHKGCFKKANFRRTHFKKKQSFANRNFISSADFSNAKFYGEANFWGATFNQDVQFSGTKFEDEAKFFEVEFNGKSRFGSTFKEDVSFLRSEFNMPAYFILTQFLKKVGFIEVKFKSDVSFEGANLLNNADFREAEFYGDLNFSYSKIGESNFQNILLPKRLIFHETRISKLIDLSFARSNGGFRTPIYLSKTPIDSLKFDYSQFYLVNEEFRIAYPYIKKGSVRDSTTFSKQEIEKAYFDIMRMQRKYNYVNGYRIADIDYQKWKLNTGFFYEKYIFLPIKKRWDNFGYNKELIITNTFILFLIFFFITLLSFPYLVTKVYNPQSLTSLSKRLSENRKGYKRVPNMLKLIPYAFFYTLIIFFGLRMELSNFKIEGNPNHFNYNLKKKFWAGFILVEYAVGLICTAYLAGYVISS